MAATCLGSTTSKTPSKMGSAWAPPKHQPTRLALTAPTRSLFSLLFSNLIISGHDNCLMFPESQGTSNTPLEHEAASENRRCRPEQLLNPFLTGLPLL